MSTKIYGASDDLIEIEGDISEEFYPLRGEGPDVLAFSNGTILSIAYTDKGVWRINLVAGGGVHIESAPENDDGNYSDIATVEEPVQWIVLGKRIAHVRRKP